MGNIGIMDEFCYKLYIYITVRRYRFLFNNQPDALIIQIYSVIKLYMFRANYLPIIRSLLLYIRHWKVSCRLWWPLPSRVRMELQATLCKTRSCSFYCLVLYIYI